MYDFKKLAKSIMKVNTFKSTEQKMFSYNKEKKTLSISPNYDENSLLTVPFLKRGANL